MSADPTGGSSPPPAGSCRVCGDPSWGADDKGPVHGCCARFEARHPGHPCPACAQAKENRLAHQHRRRPQLLAWPRFDDPPPAPPS
ncbi:MAG TPA: hypothetical protein VFJ85_12850 [Acidimicrobiales bacterium]|nr:hypothetical protein [Acidimicrobiales bacterium]